MQAAECYSDLFVNAGLPNQLLEIHVSKISLHEAKSGYSYPTIRLPRKLSALTGLQTKIYQTIQEGALAFLVVISSKTKASENPKSSVFTRRRSPVRIRASPSVLDVTKAVAFV